MHDQNTTTTGPTYGIAPPEYRLPSELRLGPVRLQVSDLERSLTITAGSQVCANWGEGAGR